MLHLGWRVVDDAPLKSDGGGEDAGRAGRGARARRQADVLVVIEADAVRKGQRRQKVRSQELAGERVLAVRRWHQRRCLRGDERKEDSETDAVLPELVHERLGLVKNADWDVSGRALVQRLPRGGKGEQGVGRQGQGVSTDAVEEVAPFRRGENRIAGRGGAGRGTAVGRGRRGAEGEWGWNGQESEYGGLGPGTCVTSLTDQP